MIIIPNLAKTEYIAVVTVNVGIQSAEMCHLISKNYTNYFFLKKRVKGQRQHVLAKLLYIYTNLAPRSVTHQTSFSTLSESQISQKYIHTFYTDLFRFMFGVGK